jgi:ketosteroid isomerase-like protein
MTINMNSCISPQMKPSFSAVLPLLTLMLGLGAGIDARADTTSQRGPHDHAAATNVDVPPDAIAVSAVVDRFAAALKKADMATIEAILDPEVLILESGYAERSRDEYLGHHAASDAAFLGTAQIELVHRSARRRGDLAWVGSEREIRTRKDDKPLTLISTETVVLKRVGEDWHIVHIHWSSHPKA